MRKNRSRCSTQDAAAAAGDEPSPSMVADTRSAASGAQICGDDDAARHSLDFLVRDHTATGLSCHEDDDTTTATNVMTVMTAWPPVGHLCQMNVLHEFIANWSDELFGGESGCRAEDIGAAVGYDDRACLLHACEQTTSSMQSVVDDPGADARAPTDTSRSLSSCLETTNGAVVTTTTVAAKPAVPKRKRIRRKAEVMQLREELKVLETTYHELREFLKQAAPQVHQNCKSRELKQDWNVIASRQRDFLSTSELKNHKLRAEYQHQRKVAMQLHRLFVKNAAAVRDVRRHFNASAYYAMDQQLPVQNLRLVLAVNLHIFQKMLLEITPMQQELARVQGVVRSREQQQQQQPSSFSTQHDHHTFRDWQVHEDSTNELFADIVDSYMLPFDRFQLNRGLRRFYGETNGASTLKDKTVSEYFLSTGDTFIRQFLATYKDPKRVAPRVRLREVVRNYSDETQCVFLVVAHIESVDEVTGEPLGALTLCEKKWTVIRSDGAKSSTVQTYHMITRDAVHRDYESLWTRKMLVELMMPTWEANLSHMQRELEAVLIDQSMAMNKSVNNNNKRAINGGVVSC